MGFWLNVLKILFIIASVLIVAIPFLYEIFVFRRDKEKKISFKRLKPFIFALVFSIAVTVALTLLTQLKEWIGSFSFIGWLRDKLQEFDSGRPRYFVEVTTVIVINFGVGFLYSFLSKPFRFGMKKKDLRKGKKKNGTFTFLQAFERRMIRFFHKETWFFVGSILKWLSILLSAAYLVILAAFLIPAVFKVDFIPWFYDAVGILFGAGYLYPTITLVVLWQAYFFLAGIQRLEEECPDLFEEEKQDRKKQEVNLEAIDKEIAKRFSNFYACSVDMSKSATEQLNTSDHHPITDFIARAVDKDERCVHTSKEVYMKALDAIVKDDRSVLISGSLFSEFSAYFLRWLTIVAARGDTVAFVCNDELQINETCEYIKESLAKQTSLFCKDFEKDSVNFDDPIWRVVKISGENDDIGEATVDDSSVLVTSLSFLCSARFEDKHKKFLYHLNAVVFVDTLRTVNTFNRQFAILNTHLKSAAATSELKALNGTLNKDFENRYVAHQVRYFCFDDSRSPGLDKVLKNMLEVDLESIDAMRVNPLTLVRCYNYEGAKSEDGRVVEAQLINADEFIGAIMNIAVLCIAKGAGNVTIFADGLVPYMNYSESIQANAGQIAIRADEHIIRLNKFYTDPNDYSVIIAMDTEDNLPKAMRKYLARVSEKPALLLIFSRPYLMRECYRDRISDIWLSKQLERIPVEQDTEKDVAQKILIQSSAGGITIDEIRQKARNSVVLKDLVSDENDSVNAILSRILEIYGVPPENRHDLYNFFEFKPVREFNESGKYTPRDFVYLRKQGRLYDLISGRDMVRMVTENGEIVLPTPRKRLTQSYIPDQNLLFEGNVYHISRIDTKEGKIFAELAVSGLNEVAYQYVPVREYRAEISPDKIVASYLRKHMQMNKKEDGVEVKDVYVSFFKAPMEVLTKGYYVVDHHSLARNKSTDVYVNLEDVNNETAMQIYRRYGELSSPFYTQLSMKGDINASEGGAMMMAIRMTGEFGKDIRSTATLAAVMLNEILRSMFPSVADSIAVCPVLSEEFADGESREVLKKQPRLTLMGEGNEIFSGEGFELLIIEDSDTDLGVISVLLSAGDDVLYTLFSPVLEYLKWYDGLSKKNDYLYDGLDHEPSCYDFTSLKKLSTLLGDDKHDRKFEDIQSLVEFDNCDFCGRRFAKGTDDLKELKDGRRICKRCEASIAGSSKKTLKSQLELARIFLESTYGITVGEDYEICFESTMKIVNTLKQNRALRARGTDVPLKAYVDGKRICVESGVPEVNVSELLVRELTFAWQMKNVPSAPEDLAEGHIALVAVQYLRFLKKAELMNARINYYESSANQSGEGYRKLVRELREKKQFRNNPFLYMLSIGGGGEAKPLPEPELIVTGDCGKSYTPEKPDRAPAGQLSYFHRARLSAAQQSAYDAIVEAILNHEGSVTVNGEAAGSLQLLYDTIKYDRPDLFWFTGITARGNEYQLIYGVSRAERDNIQRQIDNVCAKYLEGIDDGMSAYDVTVRLYTRLIQAVDYDSVALEKEDEKRDRDKIDPLRSICGALLNGKAVCEGYARALQYLLQKCGVECAELAGKTFRTAGQSGGGHAWNIVKIDGDYYQLDVTWDDNSNTNQPVRNTSFGYDYFCITSEEMARTRDFSMCPTDPPTCSALRANYYHVNDLFIDSYDLERIKLIAQVAAKNGGRAFTFKCATKELYDSVMDKLIISGRECCEVLEAARKVDKTILDNTYTYTYNDRIRTITVIFKHK